MSDQHPAEHYVIKKIKKIKGGHHGGSWKIAYADFVTAMMAFFLLMWLLALMNKYELEGFARYFKRPIKEAFRADGNNSVNETDVTKQRLNEARPLKPTADKVPSSSVEHAEQQALMLKHQLESDLDKHPQLQQYKNLLNFIVTADGLKIVLKEMQNKPMFSEGKTDFQQYAKDIISWLSQEVNHYPNAVEIIGHTDAAKYGDGSDYTNWELSADRANATRRELIKGGMDEGKILRIIGTGDKDLLRKENGLDPSNRRIEIIVLSDEAMKRIVN